MMIFKEMSVYGTGMNDQTNRMDTFYQNIKNRPLTLYPNASKIKKVSADNPAAKAGPLKASSFHKDPIL